jgi:hypothetical protein
MHTCYVIQQMQLIWLHMLATQRHGANYIGQLTAKKIDSSELVADAGSDSLLIPLSHDAHTLRSPGNTAAARAGAAAASPRLALLPSTAPALHPLPPLLPQLLRHCCRHCQGPAAAPVAAAAAVTAGSTQVVRSTS